MVFMSEEGLKAMYKVPHNNLYHHPYSSLCTYLFVKSVKVFKVSKICP